MKPFLIVFLVVAVAFGLARILGFFRARAMRSLALRRGLRYMDNPLPASFQMTCYPADVVKLAWNVIEGEQSGIEVLIFDSVIGEGKGTYCTFIAMRTGEDRFGGDLLGGSIVQSSGWTALYRLRFWQIPWTLGARRIEEILSSLGT